MPVNVPRSDEILLTESQSSLYYLIIGNIIHVNRCYSSIPLASLQSDRACHEVLISSQHP